MKRLLILLVVVLLLSSSALAGDDSKLFVGTWMSWNEIKSGGISYTIFDLREDGTAMCVFKSVSGDGEETGRNFKGSWQETSDGIHIVSGNKTSSDCIITDNGFLAEHTYGGYIMYTRLKKYAINDPEFEPVDISELSTGVWIPTGKYVIGEDIPAGKYQCKMGNSKATVEYYENSSKIMPSTSFSLDARSDTYSNLSLEEGGILEITTSAIVLSYARSIFK